MRYLIFIFILVLYSLHIVGQPVPAGDENIPFLITFCKDAKTSWGDDDFSLTFFFRIPKEFNQPVYIKVFDPDVGGKNDEINGEWNSKTRFSVYGGNECYSHKDAQETQPSGNYKSGNLLGTKVFGIDNRYDNKWYVFGPFNPTDGELVEKFDGYIFKIVVDGIAGDDGNLYRFFLSTVYNENKPVEGANAFAYEYTFRMHDNPNEVSHIYPYVDDRTVSIKLSNFDWDNDGLIRVVSVARQGQIIKVSNEDEWTDDEFKIFDEEKNSSLDIQFIKKRSPPVKNNNVVVNVRNQYGELLPFFVIPIGGVPHYKRTITVGKKNR